MNTRVYIITIPQGEGEKELHIYVNATQEMKAMPEEEREILLKNIAKHFIINGSSSIDYYIESVKNGKIKYCNVKSKVPAQLEETLVYWSELKLPKGTKAITDHSLSPGSQS